jgi:hypothetical protein
MYTIEIQDLSSVNEIVLETSLAPVQSVNGMIGAVNVSAASVGLNNVNNTADIDKPVSIPISGALLALEQRILSQVQLSNSSDLEFQVGLYSGIDSLYVNYPIDLTQKPKTVTCSIENNIDDLIYNYFISDVTNMGFNIEFSDYLSADGYILNVVASR